MSIVQSTVRGWSGNRDSLVAVGEVAPDFWVHWRTEPWPDERVEWIHVYAGCSREELPPIPQMLANSLRSTL